MRIAVIGAGLAGLSVAWHSLLRGYHVEVFDPHGIGKGASGAATGLLHPFVGKKAARSLQAREGMEKTLQLIRVSEDFLQKPAANRQGLFRIPSNEEQKKDFLQAVGPDAIWKKIELYDGHFFEGLWIESAITIFPRVYLQGLWGACARKGAVFHSANYDNENFDRVIYCMGKGLLETDFAKKLSLRTAIGQSLLCTWENPLAFSLMAEGHLTPTENPKVCQVGATYEHTKEPCPKKAEDLLVKLGKIYPPALNFQMIERRWATRVSPRDGHIPIIEQVEKNTWLFTGLGSRGMLYHGLFGSQLVSAL